METSLHGLKYLGQRKRHICERVFWLTAVIAAIIASTLLILEMWKDFANTPIVTIFSPTERTVGEIPFPAVTLCTVNNIKKSKFEEYKRLAKLGLRGQLSNETMLRRFANIMDVDHLCYSAKSFTQRFFEYPSSSDNDELKEAMSAYRSEYVHLLDATGTLRNSSQPCSEMILLCIWLNGVTDCSELFQPIETDYGYCCTFNMIPLTLLRKFVKDPVDDPKRVDAWAEANLTNGNILFEEIYRDRKYPYRQLYAGRSAGLSFLVNPNLEEYHCTSTDSEGFLIGLHSPLDFPRMKDNGIAVRTSTEVFLSVRPEITLTSPTARKIPLKHRHCYFDEEKNLSHYHKYSASNCLDECIARQTLAECGCLHYYMPGSGGDEFTWLCKPEDSNCTQKVKEKMIKGGLDKECYDCWPSCQEIKYYTEATTLRVQEKMMKDLFKYHPKLSLNGTKVKDASIIHVFFSVESIFPRLRKEASTTIDLISNAGGLLGLCMGFSLLSLLEILYHLTIRLFCNIYHDKCLKNKCAEIIQLQNDDGRLFKHLGDRNTEIGFNIRNHKGKIMGVEEGGTNQTGIVGTNDYNTNNRTSLFNFPGRK